jgi:hypothetical protein
VRVALSPSVVCRGSRLLLASALVLASAAAVSAQTPRVEGPFSGLFGGQSANRNVSHSLGARASLFGVYQDILEPSADVLQQLDPRFQRSGVFGGVSAGLAYAYFRSARRASFSAGSNASASTFSARPDLVIGSYSGVASLSANLTRRVSFLASGTGSYTPFYNFGSSITTVNPSPIGAGFPGGQILVPGALPIGGLDATIPGANFGIGAFFGPTVMLGTSTGLTANLTSRTSLGIFGDYVQMRLLESDLTNSMWGSGGVLRHRLTRQLFARLGYRRAVGRLNSPGAQPFIQHGIEAGLDYGDSLSFNLGRRTRLTVAPAASVMRWNNRTQFRLNGSATLVHNVGRSWTASAAYVRDVGFLAGFGQPLVSDSAMSSLGGTLSRRVRFTAMGSWMRGRFGFSDQPAFNWYVASSGVSVALARPVAFFTQYAYTRADVPGGASVVFGARRVARQTVSIGLTLFAPIFNTNGRVRP